MKNQLSQILQKVRDEGEVVEITYYGQKIAHLVPATSAPKNDDDLEAILSDLDSLAAEIGAAWEGDVSAVEAVREARGDVAGPGTRQVRGGVPAHGPSPREVREVLRGPGPDPPAQGGEHPSLPGAEVGRAEAFGQPPRSGDHPPVPRAVHPVRRARAPRP